ncbi:MULTISPECIES: M48 family metallopeptidase [unclassified Massilia]|uniref:M48 family metallopeptidase n=1 Tax=unclassified Massilia TaxID=2609279 RepID=UPI0017814D12|nr:MULTISPECIES: M48 family metallopeptidase [unclassified Massilia]MBD8533313.1 M48 family metallopeptidase [Massilia sp. CFBP 13647]MBD8676705.1 M48 family metallopeptidase [Massilia sp. CFBP 13721]
MKYAPSLPPDNDNVTREHPLKDFMLLLAGLAALALLVFFLLGLLVDAVVDRMGPETEASLTRIIAAKAEPPPSGKDGDRVARLQQLVDSLRSCAGFTGPATVRLTDSAVPNAMVVPGGAIYVFSGLLTHVQSENGLAFVLAHELAHLAHRDHLRALGRGVVLYGLAALIGGDGSALAGVLAPVQQFGTTSYSRARESAADALALRVLACRYGHVGGATEFFEALRARDDDALPGSHYFMSHPAMGARIDAIHAAARKAGYTTGAVLPLIQ